MSARVSGDLIARVFLLWLLLAFTTGPLARADAPEPNAAVTVQAHVDHPEMTIGDPIRYTVEVTAARETEVLIPVLSGALGDFTITDFGELPPRKDNERVVTSRWYTLTSFTTGDHLIPAPKVEYRTPGEELREAEGNEVLVGVTSLLAQEKDANDIHDIKPPESMPFDWRPYGILGAVVLGVGLLAAGFLYWITRPRRRRVVPSRPPHEIALAALDRLRAQQLVAAGRFEEYYVELSSIVRRYLEDRFGVRAPEMTTEEFLAAAATDAPLIAMQRRSLAEFLSQADLVKFARHLPTLADSEAAYNAARRFVEESRPSTASPRAQEIEHAAA